MREALTFDDVLIEPKYSEVLSRFDPSVESPFLYLPVPIISANMETVTGTDMAIAMEKAGGMGVLHRFMEKDEVLKATNLIAQSNNNVAVSLGIGDPEKVAAWAELLLFEGATTLVIDVAHGHQKRVIECIQAIREMNKWGKSSPCIVAGNVATAQGAVDLWAAGANAVKVGIGPGAACTTRTTTGIGVPQFTAIRDIAEQRSKFKLSGGGIYGYIIADGGIKNTGDFCKAMAAGADAVMMGSVLAGADESEAIPEYQIDEDFSWGGYITTPTYVQGGSGNMPTINTNNVGPAMKPTGYKVYRGSASSESREAFGIAASTGYNEHIAEGVSGRVPVSGPVADTLEHYKKALQSSMSYVGASNLREFHMYAEFVKVTNSSIIESGPRV